jgi:SAM-dependent methyltransferase
MYPPKTLTQKVFDFLYAPLRLTVLPDGAVARLGLSSSKVERLRAVTPLLQGRLLDIGCGDNELVRRYGQGVGVDVYDWGGGALILTDCSRLPFPDLSFETITILAAINHIPNREEVLKEVHRLLTEDGRLLITMINPIISYIGHRFLWWWSEDKERGMDPGEVYGFWNKDMIALVAKAGFHLISHKRFVYGLNNLFVFRKA